jgi:hypothetical protein
MTFAQRLLLYFRRIFAPPTDLEIENTILRQRLSWLKASMESIYRTSNLCAEAETTLGRLRKEIDWALDVDDEAERTPLPRSTRKERLSI